MMRHCSSSSNSPPPPLATTSSFSSFLTPSPPPPHPPQRQHESTALTSRSSCPPRFCSPSASSCVLCSSSSYHSSCTRIASTSPAPHTLSSALISQLEAKSISLPRASRATARLISHQSGGWRFQTRARTCGVAKGLLCASEAGLAPGWASLDFG
eukprot:2087709-Rhodomonas_salina.1